MTVPDTFFIHDIERQMRRLQTPLKRVFPFTSVNSLSSYSLTSNNDKKTSDYKVGEFLQTPMITQKNLSRKIRSEPHHHNSRMLSMSFDDVDAPAFFSNSDEIENEITVLQSQIENYKLITEKWRNNCHQAQNELTIAIQSQHHLSNELHQAQMTIQQQEIHIDHLKQSVYQSEIQIQNLHNQYQLLEQKNYQLNTNLSTQASLSNSTDNIHLSIPQEENYKNQIKELIKTNKDLEETVNQKNKQLDEKIISCSSLQKDKDDSLQKLSTLQNDKKILQEHISQLEKFKKTKRRPLNPPPSSSQTLPPDLNKMNLEIERLKKENISLQDQILYGGLEEEKILDNIKKTLSLPLVEKVKKEVENLKEMVEDEKKQKEEAFSQLKIIKEKYQQLEKNQYISTPLVSTSNQETH